MSEHVEYVIELEESSLLEAFEVGTLEREILGKELLADVFDDTVPEPTQKKPSTRELATYDFNPHLKSGSKPNNQVFIKGSFDISSGKTFDLDCEVEVIKYQTVIIPNKSKLRVVIILKALKCLTKTSHKK